MSDPVICAKNISKRYGRVPAVDGVSLEVPAGKVCALMGRNGAGKTSLIRMLLGLTPITNGSASVLGLDSARCHVEIRRRVGYVPEEHHLYKWMRVGEIARFCSAFYPTWDDALCKSLLDRLGLDPKKKISALSRGMTAKTALALALAHAPEALILDEPTSGLDAVVRREFLESVVDVAADEGRTVLISSHLLNDVERIADSVALLDEGKLKLVEDAAELKARMREVKILFSNDAQGKDELPGVLSMRSTAREWLFVVDDFDEQTVPALREKFPGAVIETRDMSLEEIFVALVGTEQGKSNAA